MIDLLALLKRIEWVDSEAAGPICSECSGFEPTHKEGCELKQAIDMLESRPIDIGHALIVKGLKKADIGLASLQEEYERHMPCVPGTTIRIRLMDEPPPTYPTPA